MRSKIWARGVTCVLAITTCIPLALAGGQKSVAECTSFDQNDKDDDKVEFAIHNACSMPVDCSLKWRVVCAPDAKSRKATHAKSFKLQVTPNSTNAVEASAAVCGDDSWSIDSIHWSCEPNRD